MKTRNVIRAIGSGLALILLGCGLHQDPFAGKDDRFRQGKAEPTDPVEEEPVRSDSIRFNIPDEVTFEEGKQSEFTMSARSLLPDYKVTLTVENMSEFPGAVFDPGTGKFTWLPPSGYVSAGGGGGRILRKIQLRANAVFPGKAVLYRTSEFSVSVTREFGDPLITRISKNADSLREGASMHVFVRVKDEDATDNDERTWPEIQFQAVGNQKGLGSWFILRNRTKVSVHEYEYDFSLDLTDAELTSSVTEFGVGVVALSKFGRRSRVHEFALRVLTSLADPISSWAGAEVFRAEEKRSFQFVVFDPKGEAVLKLDEFRNIPDGAKLSCIPSDHTVSVLVCSMDWTPTKDQAGKQDQIWVTLKLKNRDSRDPREAVRDVYFTYRVDPVTPARKGSKP